MSEPRVGVFREHGASGWTWQCSGVHVGRDRWSGFGAEASIAAASDAGRRHLAEHHWAPIQDQINHVVGRMGAAMNSVGPFGPCDRPDCPICATRNALQTAHNESREGC